MTDSLKSWSEELREARRRKEECERLGLPIPPSVEKDIRIYTNLLNASLNVEIC